MVNTIETGTKEAQTSIAVGLGYLAKQLDVPVKQLISCEDLTPLAKASPRQVFFAIDAIHKKWISENLTPYKWSENYFTGQLGLYRKITRLNFEEVEKDFLFIKDYLEEGGCEVTLNEIQRMYNAFRNIDYGDVDIEEIRDIVSSFGDRIFLGITAYRKSCVEKNDKEMVYKINHFLSEHYSADAIISETLSIL